MPVSFDGTITQYSGRLERPLLGKKEVRVYDYVDAKVPMLLRIYKMRLRTYRGKVMRNFDQSILDARQASYAHMPPSPLWTCRIQPC